MLKPILKDVSSFFLSRPFPSSTHKLDDECAVNVDFMRGFADVATESEGGFDDSGIRALSEVAFGDLPIFVAGVTFTDTFPVVVANSETISVEILSGVSDLSAVEASKFG